MFAPPFGLSFSDWWCEDSNSKIATLADVSHNTKFLCFLDFVQYVCWQIRWGKSECCHDCDDDEPNQEDFVDGDHGHGDLGDGCSASGRDKDNWSSFFFFYCTICVYSVCSLVFTVLLGPF